jgi:hypothetical protein
MTTSYPANVDNSITLPPATDNLTPVSASVFNNLRGALLAVETELGVKPSGVYSTVRARLDNLDTTIGNLQIISLANDLGGTLTQPLVIGIQGRPVSNIAPITGQVIAWNGIAWVPANVQGGGGGGTIIFSGDLSGTTTIQEVIGIRGISVSAIAPTINQVLQYNGSSLVFATLPAGSFTAGGDLSGTTTSQTVIRINGTTITTGGSTGQILQMTGAGAAGYAAVNLALAASITGVLPIVNQANQTMSGAVGGNTGASTINLTGNAAITGVLPSANQAAQIMGGAVGGTTATSTISLTANASITGVLPTANQASQTMGGDVSGTTASATVTKLQGNAVKSGALGATQDGYVLTWVNANSDWEAKTSSGFAPLVTGLGVYGDGSDGSATCDGSATVAGMTRAGSIYTLTRDVYFVNLTVNAGVTIMGAGWRLFVNGTLAMNGHFSVDGGLGNVSVDGAGGGGSTSTRLNGGSDGLPGGTTGVTNSFGGSGGNSSLPTSGGITSQPAAGFGTPRDLFSAINGALISGNNALVSLNGGTGGAGFGGASGGGGGGVAVVASNTLIGSGQITANGGAGINNGSGSFSGGGGGGYIALVTRIKTTWTGTTTANGGAAGGAGATAGTAGLIITITA